MLKYQAEKLRDRTHVGQTGGPGVWSGCTQWFYPSCAQPPPTPHHSLALDLRQTGPGRRLPQRQPRSLVAVQPSQFLQPQCPSPQPIPHHSLALDLGQTQQRDTTLCCFWVEPQTLTQTAYKSSVTAQASLASAITSFGAGHAFKGNRAWLNLNFRASTPTTEEQTLSLTGQWQPQSREEALPQSSTGSRYSNTNHIPYQGDNRQHTLREDVAGVHTKTTLQQKHWTYTVYIGMLPLKNTPLTSQ